LGKTWPETAWPETVWPETAYPAAFWAELEAEPYRAALGLLLLDDRAAAAAL
jgi:hypothetical protein